jgi:hypothetical protein
MDDWTNGQPAQESRLWRMRESDAYGWVKLGLEVLFVVAVLFGVVLVILYFTEGPNSYRWVPL